MPRVANRPPRPTAAAQLNHGLAGTVATVSPELLQLLERHLRARQAGTPASVYRKTPRAPPGHVRRPENSFIKFRTALYECEQVAGGAQQDLSRRAGVLWHSLPKHSTVRRLCTDLAQADARRHREENPVYKYAPLRPPKNKSKSKRAAGGGAADDDEDYDEHARPARHTRRKRTQRPVPVFTDEEEEDEAALAAGESDVGSVSSATAVGASSDSDSERESSLTAQTPPPRSPTAAPYEAVNPKLSPCTPMFTLDVDGSCTPRPSGIKTEHGRSSRLPSTDPLELLGYSWWQPPVLESWGPTACSVKFEDGGAFEQPLDVSAGPWDITREDFLLTPSSPSSTQMQVDCPSPPVSASAPDGMTVDMMMEQYINWDQD